MTLRGIHSSYTPAVRSNTSAIWSYTSAVRSRVFAICSYINYTLKGEYDMSKDKSEPKRRRGRPETRVLKIDATPEELAKCLVTPIKKTKKADHA